MWKPTNSEIMILREAINGTIRGVDFGPKVSVIARAERPMLLWLGGHSWSLNGSQRYAQSHLTIIKDRIRMDGWHNYKSLEPEGGRLTVGRVELVKDLICGIFGPDRWDGILHAVKTRQTLLIEGGGETPQPAISLGREAYEHWRDNQRASA